MALLTPGYLVKVDGAAGTETQAMQNAGAIVTEISSPGSDTNFPTEHAVVEALAAKEDAFDKGTAFNKDFGTDADTVCEGDDERLSDARTPAAHAASHASGGADAVKLDDLSAPDDNADLNATTERHGLLPKLGGGTTNFMRADGEWSEPPGAGGGAWGGITGTLSEQADLQSALDGKKATFSESTGFNKDFGSTAGTVCEGDDERLSDARTPAAHAGTHANGADDIQSATAGQKGLATAEQITKLDGIASGAASAATIWQTIYSDTGLTPDDTNTVPYTGSGIEVGMGVRVTYNDGGGDDYYYGIVSAVSAGASFDTFLAIFNGSYAVTKIEVCHASALTEMMLHAPGRYAGSAHDDLFTDWGTPVVTGKAFALGRVYARHAAADSAATTSEPAINVNIGGAANLVFSSDVAMTTSFADAAGAPSFAHYTAAAGEVVDVKIAQATGGTPWHDASDLSILIVGVPL